MKNDGRRSFFRNFITFVVLVLIVGVGGIAIWRQQRVLTDSQREYAEKQAEKEQVELDVEYMDRLLKYTQSDEYIEQQARRILGWVREDERIFVDPETTTDAAVQTEAGISTEAAVQNEPTSQEQSAEQGQDQSTDNEGRAAG